MWKYVKWIPPKYNENTSKDHIMKYFTAKFRAELFFRKTSLAHQLMLRKVLNPTVKSIPPITSPSLFSCSPASRAWFHFPENKNLFLGSILNSSKPHQKTDNQWNVHTWKSLKNSDKLVHFYSLPVFREKLYERSQLLSPLGVLDGRDQGRG